MHMADHKVTSIVTNVNRKQYSVITIADRKVFLLSNCAELINLISRNNK